MILNRALNKLPPPLRLSLLHRLGKFAPWEPQFDFTPPTLEPGQIVGPPDFVGIGVQKAGTTWWYEMLLQQPGVFDRQDLHKERHFFDRFGIKSFGPGDIAQYHGWFPRPVGSITGEWTPDYLTFPWVPPLLREAAPDARILVLLRDPVERVRSGIEHQNRAGRQIDGVVISDAIQRGFYARLISDWLDHFPKEQLLIQQFERCVDDPKGQLRTTLDFLGLPGPPVMPPLQEAVSRPRRPAASGGLRPRLVDIYSADVIRLATDFPEIDLRLWPNFSHLVSESPASSEPEDLGSSPTRRR